MQPFKNRRFDLGTLCVILMAFLALSAGAGWRILQEQPRAAVTEHQTLDRSQPTPWAQLSPDQQDRLVVTAMIFFPELFSKKYHSKYDRFSDWLSAQGVTIATVRDIFSSGGRGIITFQGRSYEAPQIFLQLQSLLPRLYETIGMLPAADLLTYWGDAPEGREARIDRWIDMVTTESAVFLDDTALPVRHILEAGRVDPETLGRE